MEQLTIDLDTLERGITSELRGSLNLDSVLEALNELRFELTYAIEERSIYGEVESYGL